MATPDEPSRSRGLWTQVGRLEQILAVTGGLLGIFALAGIGLVPESLRGAWSGGAMAWVSAMIRIFLLVLLGVAYWWSATSEKELLREVAHDHLHDVPWFAPLLVTLMVLAAAIAGLGAFIPPLFGLGLLTLKTLEAASVWIVHQQVRIGAMDLLLAADGSSSSLARRAFVLVEYYLGNPWSALLAFEMLLLAIGSCLDVLVAVAGGAASEMLTLGVSGLFVIAVLGNEIVAGRWRRQRDRQLWNPPPVPGDLGRLIATLLPGKQ